MRIFRHIFPLLLLWAGGFSVLAQTLDFGIAKTRYLYAGATFKDSFGFLLSESLFSESFKNQQIELVGFYRNSIRRFSYSAGIKAGTSWCGSYQRYSAFASLAYQPFDRWIVAAKFRPGYDTGYGYHSDWAVGLKFKPCRPLWLNLDFTTIPDYRKSERRIIFGPQFNVGALSASAAVSIPVEGDQKFRTWRILMGLNYSLNLSKSGKRSGFYPLNPISNL